MDAKPAVPHAIPAGRLIVEPDVAQLIVRGVLDWLPCLRRHLADDWGDLTRGEREENAYAVVNGGEIFSAYRISESLTLWIVSEWDRSLITLLLPSSTDLPDAAASNEQSPACGHIEF